MSDYADGGDILVKMTASDLDLLRQYALQNSEEAFATLVGRHLALVYSAALRQVRSPQLAEEVAQSAFTDLARNAHRLAPNTILTAWLYQVTRRTAIDVVRREARRQLREQIASEMNTMNATDLSRRNPMEADADWTHIEPLLDEAMHALDDTDRTAVLLRYFENKSLREVGATLGTSDDAAQKRVSRAVERLREFFAKRGVTIGASGLVVVISANAVQAAPVGLAATISTAAAIAETVTVATIATHTTMNWISIKSIAAIVTAALAAGTGTYLVQQGEANRLRNKNENLIAQQEKLTFERDRVLSAATGHNDELESLRRDRNELLSLRNEVGTLRRQMSELEKVRAENRRLQGLLAKDGQKSPQPEVDSAFEQRMQKARVAKIVTLALLMYAADNKEQFPTTFDQAASFFQEARDADPFMRDTAEFTEATKQFEIVYHGSRDALTNPGAAILIRERQAWQTSDGKWAKAYGFADGHGETHVEPDGNFDAWEKKHVIPRPPSP